MSSPASLLRGCEILHFTAHISTVGYVTLHLKGTRSKEIILPFSPTHTPFKLLAGANSSSLGTFTSSEGFTLEQSKPTITQLTVFLCLWRAFSFFFKWWDSALARTPFAPASTQAVKSLRAVRMLSPEGAEGLSSPFVLVPLGWRPHDSLRLKNSTGPIAEQKQGHGGGREGKVRRQTHFLSNNLILVKKITELSWLLESFTAAGGSKAADTRSYAASLAATWQELRWGSWHLHCLCLPWPAWIRETLQTPLQYHFVPATSCAFLQLRLMLWNNKNSTIATITNNNSKKN